MSGLKTVLVDAIGLRPDAEDPLNNAMVYIGHDDITDAVTAVRDHFLDREKVRAALIVALKASMIRQDQRTWEIPALHHGQAMTTLVFEDAAFDDTILVDRFLDALSGRAG